MKKLSYGLLSLVVLLLFSSCAPAQTEPTEGTASSSTSSGYTCGLPPSPVDREDLVDGWFRVKSSITVPAEYKLWDAGEWDVVPGQTFEWNRADEQSRLAWINGKGLSSDGLWKYLCYEHASGARNAGYKALPRQALSGGSYQYATSFSGDSVYIAKVSDFGEWFSAGTYVDVVKSFVCPSGGRVRLSSVLEVLLSYKDGVVFSVYLENRQVYPTDGSRGISLSEVGQKRFDVEIDVKKNQRIFIHIGKGGSTEHSGVRMSN
ncbi:MAG: hypothetical protein IJC19_04380, partial [Clostridia bacterium]|nr:hypothetical protein [Clostridia bacterium]